MVAGQRLLLVQESAIRVFTAHAPPSCSCIQHAARPDVLAGRPQVGWLGKAITCQGVVQVGLHIGLEASKRLKAACGGRSNAGSYCTHSTALSV